MHSLLTGSLASVTGPTVTKVGKPHQEWGNPYFVGHFPTTSQQREIPPPTGLKGNMITSLRMMGSYCQ